MQRKGHLLNSRLAGAIVRLGHGDRIVVTDAGLPLPWTVETVDLSVVPGLPTLEQVLGVIMDELQVESAFVAEEFERVSPAVYEKVVRLLQGCDLRAVPHAQLEEMLPAIKLIVRTGECSHYSNVILVAGTTF